MIVVDASVAISAIVGEDAQRRWASQRALLDAEETFAAPSVIVPEFVGRLAGLVRGQKMTSPNARKALDRFLGLGIELFEPGYWIAPRLLELGANLTTMDAVYVVLGEQLNADVITLDVRMLQAARMTKTKCKVREP